MTRQQLRAHGRLPVALVNAHQLGEKDHDFLPPSAAGTPAVFQCDRRVIAGPPGDVAVSGALVLLWLCPAGLDRGRRSIPAPGRLRGVRRAAGEVETVSLSQSRIQRELLQLPPARRLASIGALGDPHDEWLPRTGENKQNGDGGERPEATHGFQPSTAGIGTLAILAPCHRE